MAIYSVFFIDLAHSVWLCCRAYEFLLSHHTVLGPNYMRNAVFNANIMRGGNVLYRGTYFIGFFWPMDGVKPGAFSYSINQRVDNPQKIIENLVYWAQGEDQGFVGLTTDCIQIGVSRMPKVL